MPRTGPGAHRPQLRRLLRYGSVSAISTCTSLTLLGQRTLMGQVCNGYAFTSRMASITSKGVAWINASSHLLIEEDAVTSSVIVNSAKPTTSTLKLVVSNYNDPSLSLPKIS